MAAFKSRPAGGGVGASGMALGVTWAVALVGGLFVGRWLDQRLGTGYILTVVGLFAGMAIALLITIRTGLRQGGPDR
ncbi:MAG: AtpZ/AtpI family protein [Sulfobacillus sp.]